MTQTQTLFFPAAGTFDFIPPSSLPLKLIELLPDSSAVSVTQRIGKNTVLHAVGDVMTPGLPIKFTVTSPCTVAFDSPGQFSVVTSVNDLPSDTAAILDTGTDPPRLVRKRPDDSVWYGPSFTSTP